MSIENVKLEMWAIIEIMGHVVLAGKVTEQTIASQPFIRIDIPEITNKLAFTKLYNPNSIYSLTPCKKEYAIAFANTLNIDPIKTYNHDETIKKLLVKKIDYIPSDMDRQDSDTEDNLQLTEY